MQQTADTFYRSPITAGKPPFIELTGLMNKYISAFRVAHKRGIDFSDCCCRSGMALPPYPSMSDYLNQRLAYIFSGAKLLNAIQMKLQSANVVKHQTTD